MTVHSSLTRRSVVHAISSLDRGGTERMLVSLLSKFDAAVAEHVVCTLRRAGPLAAQLPPHVACISLNIAGRCRTGGLRLARAIGPRSPAIIHARNTGCWMDALVAGLLLPRARVVLGFHGAQAAGPLSPGQIRTARWASAMGARFSCVSHSCKVRLTCETGIDPCRVKVLTNGVQMSRFGGEVARMRVSVRRAWGFREQDVVVGSVASLTPVKDHLGLIRAVAQVRSRCPNLKLLMVGEGSLRHGLESFARAHGLGSAIAFAGWREDVPSLLCAMDIYACTSRHEGMSNSILEAMASGLPIIATRVGANEELVTDGEQGRLVPPRDVGELARVLWQWIQSPDVPRAYGLSARRRARGFSFEAAVTGYESYYRSLLRPGVAGGDGATGPLSVVGS